jgi:hypothetical protein
MKSGRVVLAVPVENGEEILYDVEEGISCNFFQQMSVINQRDKKIHMLGQVTKKLIASPDLESLFSGAK